MGKKKAITLLSIISVLMAFVLVMSFIRFSVGIYNYNSVVGAIELDYDLKGGTAYTLTLSEDNEEEVKDINKVLDTLEYRLSELGYELYSVKALKSPDPTVKDYDIRIETLTTDSLAQDIEVVAAYGEVKLFGGSSENPTTEILEGVNAIADAKYMGTTTDASGTAYYPVSITFTDEGYNALMEILDGVESGSKYYLSIKLGDNELYPGTWELLKTSFQGKTLIGGGVSEKAAKQIALQIRTGGLKYEYEISDPVTISSNYGPNVDTRALIAVGALVVVVMTALIVLYRGLGVVGALSMLLFILLEALMLIAVPNVVVSLGGVIGIMVATLITALGVTYTLNSIKKEFATTEKTVVAAVKKGFKDTLMPIIGGGVVSGAFAIALLALCSGLAKGFAITLGIGVVVGLLSTLLFTRMFTALILPLAENKEKLLNLKREDA